MYNSKELTAFSILFDTIDSVGQHAHRHCGPHGQTNKNQRFKQNKKKETKTKKKQRENADFQGKLTTISWILTIIRLQTHPHTHTTFTTTHFIPQSFEPFFKKTKWMQIKENGGKNHLHFTYFSMHKTEKIN